MILTTLTAAALGTYTLKTALGIARDQDVQEALHRLKLGVTQAVHTVQDGVTNTATRVRENKCIAGFARQNNLLVTRVFESATEEERQTLVNILNKYASK